MTSDSRCIRPLANDYVVIHESPDPARVFCYTPGIAKCDDRLIATLDLGGPGVQDLDDIKGVRGGKVWQGRIYTSDDHGRTWTSRGAFPFLHARPFVVGKSIYVLGHAGDLMVVRSDDGGETWSQPSRLTDGEHWHQSAANVWYANGCVYLVMERHVTFDIKGWGVGELAPVLMRGRLDADLTRRENWTFASVLSFRDTIPNIETDPAIDYFGVPFYDSAYPSGWQEVKGRGSSPIGWLETNVVQFTDPKHYWYDPEGKTFHLWARAHTGGTGYAAIAKVVEKGASPGTGAMETVLERVPSGKHALFLPCPGGQMRFHVLYDDEMKLFWLLSTQATDSMTRAELLPADRFNLPNNERRRLTLHFSKNMIDWCFACMVAIGPVEHGSRHYASMAFDGDDLHVVSRSGDERASCAHNGNLITFHTVRNFRNLVY